MKKIMLLSLLTATGLACASIPELLPKLSSNDLAVQTEAQNQLLAECAKAGRPGAEAERKAICDEMCRVLKKDCPVSAATQLVRNLQHIGGEESVATLAAMLNVTDAHLRDDVRQALAVNPSSAAGDALEAALGKAKDPLWIAGLIEALGERREAGASAVIAPWLGSRDPMVWTAAGKALSRLNEPDGIRALAAKRARETDQRKAALLTSALFETDRNEVFRKLCADSEPDDVRAVALLGLVLQGNDDLAADALASGKAGFQCAVIEAASQSRDDVLCALVAQNLSQLPAYLQVQALGMLEFSANTLYSKAVVQLLASSDANVQAAAAQALARIGTADAVPALLAVGTEDAKKALGLVNDKRVDDILLKASQSGAHRATAIEALALRGRADLMDSFFTYAADPSPSVAKAGIQAIAELGRDEELKQVVALLLANEQSPLARDVLKAAVAILRRSTDQEATVLVLVEGMAGASPRGQAMILQVLSQAGGRAALVPVAQAVRSSDDGLRKEAVKQLGNWPDDDAIPALLDLAGDASVPLADHVLAIRGIARLLAAQDRIDVETAENALGLCRRDEEREQMRTLIDKAKN